MRLQSLDDPSIDEPAAAPSQEARLEFGDFRRAFWQLAENQREVLILIGASGLSYDEVVDEPVPAELLDLVDEIGRRLG